MNRLRRLKLVTKKGRDFVLTNDGKEAARKAANPSDGGGAVQDEP
jgi:hypothetical protein